MVMMQYLLVADIATDNLSLSVARSQTHVLVYYTLKLNAGISSDIHQLHYIPLQDFTIIIIIFIFDTVLRQKRTFEHEQ